MRPDGHSARPAGPDMGAWPWRGKDRPEDRRTASAPPSRLRQGPADVTPEPPTSGGAARVRLGVDVLPEPGRAPRRTADPAREAAQHDGGGAEADPPSSTSDADEHVRRALALAELSRLVADQD